MMDWIACSNSWDCYRNPRIKKLPENIIPDSSPVLIFIFCCSLL